MLQLFDKYFLMVVVIQGFIVGILDSRDYSRRGLKALSMKARLIAGTMVILAVVLFVSSRFAQS